MQEEKCVVAYSAIGIRKTVIVKRAHEETITTKMLKV